MRKSLLLVIPALISLSFTACSKKEASKVKAKIAGATDNGSKKALARDIESDIQKDIKSLNDIGVTSMNNDFKAWQANFMNSVSAENREKAKSLLTSIKQKSDSLKEAAEKQSDSDVKAAQLQKAADLRDRATKSLNGLDNSASVKGTLDNVVEGGKHILGLDKEKNEKKN